MCWPRHRAFCAAPITEDWRGIVCPWQRIMSPSDFQPFTSSHWVTKFQPCTSLYGQVHLLCGYYTSNPSHSPSLCDKSSRRVGWSGAGVYSDIHLSGCWRANTHHHLEAELGTYSCQQQVGPFTSDFLYCNSYLYYADSNSDCSGCVEDDVSVIVIISRK